MLGINVEKGETDHHVIEQQILTLLKETASFLVQPYQFDQEEIILNSAYTGSGYGIVGEREQEAIKIMAQTEGILLDPVYTGRAMGGLIDMIIKKEIDSKARVLFWHTGGTPALFAHAQDIV